MIFIFAKSRNPKKVQHVPHIAIGRSQIGGSFENGIPVFSGPMVTVLGTSLQNKDLLKFFHESTWEVIGLEMEGAYYQKAIQSASKIRKSIPSPRIPASQLSRLRPFSSAQEGAAASFRLFSAPRTQNNP